MNASPKGDPKVKIEYEGTVNQVPWLVDLAVQVIALIVIGAIIFNKPEWIAWLLSWLPGR